MPQNLIPGSKNGVGIANSNSYTVDLEGKLSNIVQDHANPSLGPSANHTASKLTRSMLIGWSPEVHQL